jgi:hypothetical protein
VEIGCAWSGFSKCARSSEDRSCRGGVEPDRENSDIHSKLTLDRCGYQVEEFEFEVALARVANDSTLVSFGQAGRYSSVLQDERTVPSSM